MTRATPWADWDGCIAELSRRRDALTRQIENLEALRLRHDDRDVQIVLRYVVLGSMKKASDWANDQGWRKPGGQGNERRYTDNDVKALLDSPPPGVEKDLISMVHDIFNANIKQVNRSYG